MPANNARDDDLLRAMVIAARTAGDYAMTQWPRGETAAPRHWDKRDARGVASPVSEVDLAVDTMLRDSLVRLDPNAGWLSEESVDDPARMGFDRMWCVDPIDGTRDFIRGRAGWAISIARISGTEPTHAVLYAPVSAMVFTARAGAGAFCNDQPLQASTRRELPGARVPAHDLPKADRDLIKVEQPNSIALRMAMVAQDAADLVVTARWGNEWDVAAADLIAREAGAVVTDAHGSPLRYNQPTPQAFGIICAAPGIHAAAQRRLHHRL